MSDKRALRNFVNGESVDAADGRTTDLVDPSTGEVFGTAPVSGAADVDRALRRGGRGASRPGATPRRRSGSRRCSRSPTSLEAHADELVAIESRRTPASRSR